MSGLSAAELNKIWGTKKLPDGTMMITSYKGEDTEIIIPSSIGESEVTSIDSTAFSINAPRITGEQKKIRANLTSVEFPGSIREIPGNMFSNGHPGKACKTLKKIILNEGITKISNNAFLWCSGIEELSIPNSVKEIGKAAFSGCQSLKTIILPNELESIPASCFERTGLECVIIPNAVKTIGEKLFNDCKQLSSVTLPDSIRLIPDYSFSGCRSLSNLVLPSKLTDIGNSAFFGCAFREIYVPETVVSIGKSAFARCEKLQKIHIPKTATLGNEVFSGCTELANKNGQIIVEGVLYGITDPYGGTSVSLSKKAALMPLVLSNEIEDVVVSNRQLLPEIICKECSDKGVPINVLELHTGDEVFFGRFPTEEDYYMKPLKWHVLAVEDEQALLITEDEIIRLRDDLSQCGSWADSDVRKLLNEGFYKLAFSDLEKEQIILTRLTTRKKEQADISDEAVTDDYVFLLSSEEVKTYMPKSENRTAKTTGYAHTYPDNMGMEVYWQTRTLGSEEWGPVAVADSTGDFTPSNGRTKEGIRSLRPAIWIK